jgi:GNAT superfamily N-acetyltransferase
MTLLEDRARVRAETHHERELADGKGASAHTVAPVPTGAETAAIETIARAFLGDPVAHWAWPEESRRLSAMRRLARAFGGGAFDHASAFCTKGFIGVALWLPPGVHPDEDELVSVINSTAAPDLRDEVLGTFEQMASFHPNEPHWHLPLIGVNPAHQGQGHGDALLAHTLKFCDRAGVAAYLEASSERSVPLYRRHGFEPLGAIQAGSSPILTPMLRRLR